MLENWGVIHPFFYGFFMISFFLGFFALSTIALSIWVFILLKKLQKPPEKTEQTLDATELLKNLMNGGAVIVTQVIDPTHMFLHSPGKGS